MVLLELLGKMILNYLEKEFLEHEPEIQQVVIEQLDKFSKLIFDYVQNFMINNSQNEESYLPDFTNKDEND